MMKARRTNKILLLLCVVSIAFFSSCVSKKDIVYFQNDAIEQEKVSNSFKTIIKPDDLLQITITALDVEAVRPFNLASVTYSATSNAAMGQAQLQTYLVDTKGEIEFPVLGKIKIGGLTRDKAINLLKSKLSPNYIKDPNVNIRITNYKISLLGDVKRPGTYNIPNERITILDALALAGDVNISGQRNNVLIIREEAGEKKQYRVDLRSNQLLTSPVYYLQQNDVVYVEPNYASVQSASSNSNTTLFISLTGLIITIVSLLTR
jgi:polysaccharide export outer membrane protein